MVDVACDGGEITFGAADRVGSAGEVLGSDISDKMVARAGVRAGPRRDRRDAASPQPWWSNRGVGLG